MAAAVQAIFFGICIVDFVGVAIVYTVQVYVCVNARGVAAFPGSFGSCILARVVVFF